MHEVPQMPGDGQSALQDLAVALDGRIDGCMNRRRAAHSRSVADLAAELCFRNGLDPLAGRVAGLAHDLCKEFDRTMQEGLARAWAERSGLVPRISALLGGALMHGPAAAELLASEYGIEDRDILEAVAFHTVGTPGMRALAQILYAADKLEPGRRHVNAAFREACLVLPPEELFSEVLSDSVRWLLKEGLPVEEGSLAMYHAMRKRKPAP
ncbi:MAG: bis(5'-nucleosyl)-tetraphosphatase (symmetrical) YqeK [Spirochaetota bacterium]